MQQQPQQTNEIGHIGIFDTALLASAGVSFAVGVAPLGGLLIGIVAARTAWRWHRPGIVTLADRTLTDSVQTYQTVKAIPKTARRIASTVHERTKEGAATPPAPPAAAVAAAEPDQGVLDTLAGKHHLLVVGHTGGGKSVLLHNLAKRLSGTANVLVCDVDSVRGTYPDYRVVGSGDDYDAISSALQLVRKEVGKRRGARAAGTRSFKAMWVFIDEAHDVFASVDFARELFIDVVRRGRKLNIHMAIGTQDSLVKTLGLEGQSKALVNLTRCDVTTRGGQRTASIDGNEYPVPDLPHPDDMVQQTSPDRSSRPVQTRPDQANNDLLATLLKGSLGQSDGADRTTTDQSTDQGQTSPDQSTDQGQTTPDWYQAIRDKLAEGQSKNQIWQWLRLQQVTRSKGVAYKMIEAATEAEEPTSGGLLGDYLGDREE